MPLKTIYLAIALFMTPGFCQSVEMLCPGVRPLSLQQSTTCRASFLSVTGEWVCLPPPTWNQLWMSSTASGCVMRSFQGAKRISRSASLDEKASSDVMTSATRVLPLPLEVTRKASFLSSWMRRIDRSRLKLSSAIRDHDHLGLIRSLIIGEKPPRNAAELFALLGFVHVLNLTGVHFHFLLAFFRKVSQTLWLDAFDCDNGFRIFARLGGLSALLMLWIFSGARMGALRPLALLGLRHTCRVAELPLGKLQSLGVLFAFEMGAHLFGGGYAYFWRYGVIYYLAVGGFYLFNDYRSATPSSGIVMHLCASAASCFFVYLYEGLRGHILSLWTPLLNLISFPLQAILILPGAFAEACRFLLMECTEEWNLSLLHPFSLASFRMFDAAMTFLVKIEMRFALLLRFDPKTLIFSLVMVMLLVHFRELARTHRLRAMSAGIVLALAGSALFTSIRRNEIRHSKAIQLDVGQGDAFYVRDRQKSWLIDVGSARAVSPVQWLHFLERQKVNRLEGVMLTHPDEDHRGGLPVLQALTPIETVFDLSSPVAAFPPDFPGDFTRAELSPARPNGKMNGYLVRLGKGRVLLNLGDANTTLEKKFLPWLRELHARETWSYRILKLNHHGSATSSGEELLRIYRPHEVWISYGAGNAYGHPTLAALKRVENYCQSPCRVRHTAVEGGIHLETSRQK